MWRKLATITGFRDPGGFPWELISGSSTSVTTEPMTIYCSPTGDDANPGTQAQPKRQISSAIRSLPNGIRHPVLISAAAGDYEGVAVTGFNFDPADHTLGAYIHVLGTFVAPTLATGTVTGTSTAGTAGGLTHTGQNWTVDALRGKLIEITSGPGAGQVRTIASNTVDTVTIAGTWTAPTASGYAIWDDGTVISTPATLPALPGQAVATAAGLLVGNNPFPYGSTVSASLFFQRVKFAPTTGNAVRLRGFSNTFFNECQIMPQSSSSAFFADNAAAFACTNTAIVGTTGTALLVGSQSTGSAAWCRLLNCLVSSALTAGGVMTLMGANFLFSGCEIRGTASSGTAQLINSTFFLANVQLVGSRLIGNGVQTGVLLAPSPSAGGPCVMGWNDTTMTGCLNGVDVRSGGSLVMSSSSSLTGTGAGTALSVSKGGRIEYPNTLGVTSWGTDISVDGAAYVFATVNAATPPCVFNTNYGSWIGR